MTDNPKRRRPEEPEWEEDVEWESDEEQRKRREEGLKRGNPRRAPGSEPGGGGPRKV